MITSTSLHQEDESSCLNLCIVYFCLVTFKKLRLCGHEKFLSQICVTIRICRPQQRSGQKLTPVNGLLPTVVQRLSGFVTCHLHYNILLSYKGCCQYAMSIFVATSKEIIYLAIKNDL